MSSELLKTRCTKGFLISYDDKITIESPSAFGNKNVATLFYNQITGVEIKLSKMSPFASTVKIFSLGNQILEASLVKTSDARKFEELVIARIGKGQNVSSLDDLEKLSVLKDKGVITQEEFDTKKKQMLGI